MNKLHIPDDYEKSTQALNFFAIKEGGIINKMKAIKLVFLADRYHLRKYGRLVTNDNYVAMRHGPVPSTALDIANSNDYLDDEEKRYSSEYINPMNNRELTSVKEVDKAILSESDIEALEFAWTSFGRYNQYQLRDITHSYPEWQKHKGIAERGSCAEIDILDFLEDPTERVDESLELDEEAHKIFELNAEERKAIAEELNERSLVESLWR